MSTIKITAIDPFTEDNSEKEYEISIEIAKIVIATIEKHIISTVPIKLTEQSKKPYYFFSGPAKEISAFHLPHHTRPGDEHEIYDHKTKETYRVTFSQDYLRLCYYSGADKDQNVRSIKQALSQIAVNPNAGTVGASAAGAGAGAGAGNPPVGAAAAAGAKKSTTESAGAASASGASQPTSSVVAHTVFQPVNKVQKEAPTSAPEPKKP